MSYICANCQTVKHKGDIYYQVRIVTEEGKTEYVATCSEVCAEAIQLKYIKIHQQRVDSVKNQCFQKMEWGKYL